MSLPRYVINFEEVADDFLTSPDQENISKNFGKQYSKGFCCDLSELDYLEYRPDKNILISSVEIGTTSNSFFGETNFDMYIQNKIGTKKYIFNNVYIKDIYESKDFLSYLSLRTDETLYISFNNSDNNIEYVFIDIDFLEVEEI